MHSFYRAATRHPKTMVLIFVLLAAACALCKPLIAVNYDMNDYLPPDTASTLALDAMDAEYDGGVPNARVMVKNVSVPEALSYKEKLEAIDGVTGVTWLDDAANVQQPLETLDQDTVSSYYQDDAALFSVTIAEDKRITAVDVIRELIGDDNAMSGSAVSTAIATTSTVSQIQIISVAAVAFVLFILMLTTTSWLEPLVVLGSLGVAILINSGSNLIFGEISFVSNAAGSILQLAVSLDYSIFLLHRFEECRRETPEPREAMVEALCKSTMSILSSGLTTVIGFLALCLMQFQIGPDMGLVLGKGVGHQPAHRVPVFALADPAVPHAAGKDAPSFVHAILPRARQVRHAPDDPRAADPAGADRARLSRLGTEQLLLRLVPHFRP